MKVGDTVQVKQLDHGLVQIGEEPRPMIFWLYATVLEVLDDGAMVEIAHPANREHGVHKKVLRADIRTLEDVRKVHDTHPQRKLEKLDFNRHDHKELNNLRVAIERLSPKKEEAA